MPPSAISGIRAAGTPIGIRRSACSCGTPKLVVSRVVQPPPGPMPTLMRVDAALGEKAHAFGGGDVAGDELDVAEALAERLDRPVHHDRVAVRDVDHDHVDVAR